ncbi:MAG: 4-hydroxybenzoate polyprenyltransferase [Candidatus Aenigmatarchaeota archaeon]|nr:MAG: 4-hydroxybenzoate polyprenyltransferase [Candidatus Aenigmarchaeota archaeon]
MINYYFSLMRIKNWRAYLLISILGFLLSFGYTNDIIKITAFFIAVSLYLGFSFSINECFDTSEDRLKGTKNPIALGKIKFEHGLCFSGILAILGLSLAAVFGMNAFLFYLTMILLSLAYSSKPLRLKSRFILDLLSHGLFFGAFLFIFPFIVFSKAINIIHYLIMLVIFYFSIILELRNHISDFDYDRRAGLKTSACVLGKDKSIKVLRFLFMLYPLSLLPIFLLTNLYYLFFVLASTLYLLLFLFKDRYIIIDIYTNISLFLIMLKLVVIR